ncbi:MAG: family 16 glycosylhydrolase [Oscillospiraceae bacterium]|nr:family 16 glycosylhydrolase [Oscillospiraceae bacterium]
MNNKTGLFLKKILCCLVCAVISPVFSGFSEYAAYADSAGDITGDASVDLCDFIKLRQAVCDSSIAGTAVMDINNDLCVDVMDVHIMQKYLLGIITELPEHKTHEDQVTQVYASDDISVRSDSESDEEGLITVSGYNALARRNVYLKFQTQNLKLSDVKKAKIRMKLAKTTNGNCEIKVYACSSQWLKNSALTFDDLPERYGLCDIQVTRHPDDQGSVIDFDVTDVVRDNPGASEYNFVLLCDHENNSDGLSNLAFFYSSASGQPDAVPELVVTSGEPQLSDADTYPADKSSVRLELSQKQGWFIREEDGVLTTGKNVSPLSSAKFMEKQGFMGQQTVALESKTKPGYYLCRKSGCSEVVLAYNDNSEVFRKNSSFIKTGGLMSGTSYELYSYPGRWLRCEGEVLFISGAESERQTKSESFLVRSEKNVMLDEEFDSNDLNTDVWAYSYPWSDHHNYSAVVRQSQVAVRDGRLVLTATRVADDDWIKDNAGETGYTDNIGEKKWRKYSHKTGVIHLPFDRYPLNGNLYIEGRFRMPDKSGFWPAFWLNGNNSWPPEIDIFEYLSNTPEKIYVGIHRQDSSKANSDAGAGWWITRNPSFFQNEFHTYALDWGKTYINYYIDDVLVRSIEDMNYINNQKNMYMIINLGVGGWAEEPEDSPGDNTTFECDYVHIFRY